MQAQRPPTFSIRVNSARKSSSVSGLADLQQIGRDYICVQAKPFEAGGLGQVDRQHSPGPGSVGEAVLVFDEVVHPVSSHHGADAWCGPYHSRGT